MEANVVRKTGLALIFGAECLVAVGLLYTFPGGPIWAVLSLLATAVGLLGLVFLLEAKDLLT